MQSFFTGFVISQFMLHFAITQKITPSFFPYCSPKDICQSSCTCEAYPNCMLLNMDESIRNSILFYHNQIRNIQCSVDPQPAGMTMLHYDKALEEISKCWAAKCNVEISDCFVTSRFSETSQSVVQLVLDEGQQPNVFLWMQVMNDALGQVRLLTPETITSVPNEAEKLNSCIQLLSDRIYAVGCAWSVLENVLTLVCTYGPRGPIPGESVYKIGFPCSFCPGGYSCDYAKPFEQLCKLKIYSTISQPSNEMFMSGPPPPLAAIAEITQDPDFAYAPSPPALPEHPSESKFGQQLPSVQPIPPQLPFFPPAGETMFPLVTTSTTQPLRKGDEEDNSSRKIQSCQLIVMLCAAIRNI